MFTLANQMMMMITWKSRQNF